MKPLTNAAITYRIIHGIPLDAPRYSTYAGRLDIGKAQKMRLEGKSYAQIGVALNVSRQTVWKTLKHAEDRGHEWPEKGDK